MDGRPRTPSTPHPCHGRSAPNSFDAAAMASYARSACGVGGLGELRRHLPPPPSPPTRTAGSRSPLLFRVCRQGGAAPDAGRSSSRGCGGAAPAAGRSSSRGCGGAAQSAGRSRLEAIAAGACVLFLPLGKGPLGRWREGVRAVGRDAWCSGWGSSRPELIRSIHAQIPSERIVRCAEVPDRTFGRYRRPCLNIQQLQCVVSSLSNSMAKRTGGSTYNLPFFPHLLYDTSSRILCGKI
ncbi:uncharacterized protein LOC119318256 isoform X1 [Triticum dicoccoides]|uniref:uncharacterized protein LOC119318256 isoform X1 n=1 Tax=Triticum dicoccoides TaxID=85692 RepID=UPI001890FD5A|nr:uncharacterized protein LOC119318256 isoform X1 [Triticum dicoccoides]